MENFQITDSQLSASSEYRNELGAGAGRLNYYTSNVKGGSWCPADADQNRWFQVDFLRTLKVTGLATQGRHRWPEWVTKYTLSYKQENDNDDVEFQLYKQQGEVKVSRTASGFTTNQSKYILSRRKLNSYAVYTVF
jgi:hypothetical protein